MKSEWLKNLPNEDKEEFERNFKLSEYTRNRLAHILTTRVDANQRQMRNKDNYDKPRYPEFIADSLGYERALIEVINLLS